VNQKLWALMSIKWVDCIENLNQRFMTSK